MARAGAAGSQRARRSAGPMIVVRIQGGLGNQLFQYALGRALCASSGAELVLDRSWFDGTHRQTTRRSFELDRYPIAARSLCAGELPRRLAYAHPVLKRLPLGRLRGSLRLVRERHPGFDAAVSASRDGVYLDGYWQSPRYFDPIASVLRREFQPRESPGRDDSRLAGEIAACESVAIHVRRGDYVSLPAAARAHGALPLAYYRHAVRFVRGKVPSPRFFVFSDDIAWTRAHLPVDDAVYVFHNGPGEAHRDLRLMASCRHQVVANSSLSWWAGWLNPSPSKIVVAPRPWFLRGDPPDLVPGEWTRLDRGSDEPADREVRP